LFIFNEVTAAININMENISFAST